MYRRIRSRRSMFPEQLDVDSLHKLYRQEDSILSECFEVRTSVPLESGIVSRSLSILLKRQAEEYNGALTSGHDTKVPLKNYKQTVGYIREIYGNEADEMIRKYPLKGIFRVFLY